MDDDMKNLIKKSYEQVIDVTGTLYTYLGMVERGRDEVRRTSRHSLDYSNIVDNAIEIARKVRDTHHEFNALRKGSDTLEVMANLLKQELKKSGSYRGKYN